VSDTEVERVGVGECGAGEVDRGDEEDYCGEACAFVASFGGVYEENGM